MAQATEEETASPRRSPLATITAGRASPPLRNRLLRPGNRRLPRRRPPPRSLARVLARVHPPADRPGASSSSVSAGGRPRRESRGVGRATRPLFLAPAAGTSPSENLRKTSTPPARAVTRGGLALDAVRGSRDDAAKRAPSFEFPPERERVEKNLDDPAPAESPLHVPLREDSDADRDDQDDASVGGSSDDDAPEDDRGGARRTRVRTGGRRLIREGFGRQRR